MNVELWQEDEKVREDNPECTRSRPSVCLQRAVVGTLWRRACTLGVRHSTHKVKMVIFMFYNTIFKKQFLKYQS